MQSWVLGDRANSPILGPCLIVKVSRGLTSRTLCCRARHSQGLHCKNSIFNF